MACLTKIRDGATSLMVVWNCCLLFCTPLTLANIARRHVQAQSIMHRSSLAAIVALAAFIRHSCTVLAPRRY